MDGFASWKGIREIVDFLGEDVEAIRAVVPKIKLVAANPAAIEAVGTPLSQFRCTETVTVSPLLQRVSRRPSRGVLLG
jgi:hypothetical protein